MQEGDACGRRHAFANAAGTITIDSVLVARQHRVVADSRPIRSTHVTPPARKRDATCKGSTTTSAARAPDAVA